MGKDAKSLEETLVTRLSQVDKLISEPRESEDFRLSPPRIRDKRNDADAVPRIQN